MPNVSYPRSLLVALLAASLIAGLAPAARAAAHRLASSDIIELNNSVRDPLKAQEALVRIRGFLGEKPDSMYVTYLRQLMLTALVVT